jgi:hypothetical protein
MSWHYLYIDDPIASLKRSGEFCNALIAAGLSFDGSNAAIYAHFDLQKGGVHYYFSPGAIAVALMFGAVSQNQPAREAIGEFVEGDRTLIDRLYP